MSAYFTFRDQKYGIQFIIEHGGEMAKWQADYVAFKIIEEQRMIRLKAWRMHPENQMANVNESEIMDKLLKDEPLHEPVTIPKGIAQNLLDQFQQPTGE